MNTEIYEDDVTLLTREDLEDRVVFLENKNRELQLMVERQHERIRAEFKLGRDLGKS